MTVIDPGEILIPLHEIAKTLGWGNQKTLRAFCRCSWAVQPCGPGTDWHCHESVFAAQMPRYYLQWRELKDAGAFLMPNKARTGNQNARNARNAREPKLGILVR
jgi:hypothetical protein